MKAKAKNKLSRPKAIYAVIIVGILGAAFLVFAKAAISTVSLEGESGTRTGAAQLVQSDTSASANSYVRFGQGSSGTVDPPSGGKKCTVALHGAGGGRIGSSDWGRYNNQPVALVQPSSPDGAFWLYDGPHNQQYDPTSSSDEAQYASIVTHITNAANNAGCNGAILLMGASNGGGLATKIYCRGYNFNGRLAGIILEDPVIDQAALNCSPQNLKRRVYLYSDGIANEANQGVNVGYRCSRMPSQWYCENDTAMSRGQFEQLIGITGIRQRQYHSCSDPNNSSCGYVNNNESWGQQIDRFWRDYDSL